MITKEQALTANHFHVGECKRHRGPRGGITEEIQTWRRSGATKTWKTRPDEFRVPVKFGLYGNDHITDRNCGTVHVPEDCPLRDLNYFTTDKLPEGGLYARSN